MSSFCFCLEGFLSLLLRLSVSHAQHAPPNGPNSPHTSPLSTGTALRLHGPGSPARHRPCSQSANKVLPSSVKKHKWFFLGALFYLVLSCSFTKAARNVCTLAGFSAFPLLRCASLISFTWALLSRLSTRCLTSSGCREFQRQTATHLMIQFL